jgi:hypothetical protein
MVASSYRSLHLEKPPSNPRHIHILPRPVLRHDGRRREAQAGDAGWGSEGSKVCRDPYQGRRSRRMRHVAESDYPGNTKAGSMESVSHTSIIRTMLMDQVSRSRRPDHDHVLGSDRCSTQAGIGRFKGAARLC